MNENDETQNLPMEFKILEVKPLGFTGMGWFHDDTKLGTDRELESILNRFGNEGWDIVQIIPSMVGGNMPPYLFAKEGTMIKASKSNGNS